MSNYISDMPEFPYDLEESLSLIIVRRRRELLLGQKVGGFGQGKLVFPGGKDQYYMTENGIALVPGAHGAARELGQETGLFVNPEALRQAGTLFVSGEEDEKEIRVYSTQVSDGRRVEPSNELSTLGWYDDQSLPYDKMPPDYRLWLPHILAGYAVNAFFELNGDDRVITSNVFRLRMDPPGRLERAPVTGND